MNVSQIMKRNCQICQPGDSLAVAAGKMWEGDIGSLPVVNAEGAVVGMVAGHPQLQSSRAESMIALLGAIA